MGDDELKNKIINKILLILIILMLILNLPSYSNAFSIDTLWTDAGGFISEGSKSNATGPSQEDLKPLSDSISNILLTIAVGVTLVSVAVMGVNFMIQSVEDKAKIKESMVPWVIGIFITFGAFGIWKITIGIFGNLL